jgi:hypothetical protein
MKFNLLYKPAKHEGRPNKDGKTLNYQIFTPESGFGNGAEGNPFAGFVAQKADGSGYRSFKWNRVVALVPA